MAASRSYSEKFLLPDPFSDCARSRTTHYRNEKRRRMEGSPETAENVSLTCGNTVPQEECDDFSAATVQECCEDFSLSTLRNNCDDVSARTVQEDCGNFSTATVDGSHDTGDFITLCERSDFISELEFGEHISGNNESSFLGIDEDITFDTESVADQPLYEGSTLFESASGILILQNKMKHNLTLEAVKDLLMLIKLHCPSPNNCISSVYYLKKFFDDLQYPIIHHHVCNNCFALSNDLQSCCSNTDCLYDIHKDGNKSSFIQMLIEPQLQALLKSKPAFT